MEDISLMGELPSGSRYYAVFDGHGGEEVAIFAARNLFHFLQNLDSPPSTEQIAHAFALTDGRLQTHGEELINCARNPKKKRSPSHSMQMLEMRRDYPEMPLMEINSRLIARDTGAVASVAFVHDLKLTVATLGDCQAFVARRDPDGNLLAIDLQSRIHQLGDIEESSRVREAGLEVSGDPLRIQGSLAVSRAIGDLRFKLQERDGAFLPAHMQPVSIVPEIFELDITEDDEYVFLGCDGIFEMMSPQQIVDHLSAAPDDLCSLLDACIATDSRSILGKDNMTAVLAHLTPVQCE